MEDALRGVLQDVLGIAASEYRDDLRMQDVEAWDSVMHMTLLLTIEQTFGVTFEPEEGQKLTSVGLIREALRARGKLS